MNALRFHVLEQGLIGLSANAIRVHARLYEEYVKKAELAGPHEYAAARNAVSFHENYFSSLVDGGSQPTPEFVAWIEQRYAGMAGLVAAFAMAIEGSDEDGWAILARDRANAMPIVLWVGGHDRGWPADHDVALALDLHEHAYLFDYSIARSAYVEALLRLVDWATVSRRVQVT